MKEHCPYGLRFLPNPTPLRSPLFSSSPRLRQEKESLKPTLMTSSTPSSSLDVPNGSGRNQQLPKSSMKSLDQLLESKNKDSLYESKYQLSPTSFGSPVAASSPHLSRVTETENLRRSSEKVVCTYIGTNSCRFGLKCHYVHPNGGFNKSASSTLAGAPMMIPSDQQLNSATTVPWVYLTSSNHIIQPQEAPLSTVQTTTGVTDWTPQDDNIINTSDIPALANPSTSSNPEAYINGVRYGPQQRLREHRLPLSQVTENLRRLSEKVVCKYIGTNSCRFGLKCHYVHPNGGFNKSSTLAGAPMMIPSDQQLNSATTVPWVYLTSSNHITQPQEAPLSTVQTTTGVTDWTPQDDNIINTSDIPALANPSTSSNPEAYINGVRYRPQQRLREHRLPVFKEVCPAE
ncbi:hypothetical protein C5167_003361 [Papaver somniferum]|uniref:C3H1-type domain-containing protein n=1 Tax=Papaver somniferum TaxID=3469 RepID=A0A4Y7L1W4_PAPSO|nr:hypothetical protein C5167_003361 [Papaver somniferum]